MPTALRKLGIPLDRSKISIQTRRTRTVFEKPLQQGFGVHDPLEGEFESQLVSSKKKTPLKKIILLLQG